MSEKRDEIEKVVNEIYCDLDLDGQEDWDRVSEILYRAFPKPATVPSAEELQKLATALTYILSDLAKNVWMGARGEKDCIRAVEEFEENAQEHIKRYFEGISSAQRQAGREDMREILTEAMDAMDERRCYLDIWEWKYGERKAILAPLNKDRP